MDSIFHEHRSKHGLREGEGGREGGRELREGEGVGFRWKSNTTDCRRTSQTIGGAKGVFYFAGGQHAPVKEKPTIERQTAHTLLCFLSRPLGLPALRVEGNKERQAGIG